jgi:hypothetical protein
VIRIPIGVWWTRTKGLQYGYDLKIGSYWFLLKITSFINFYWFLLKITSFIKNHKNQKNSYFYYKIQCSKFGEKLKAEQIFSIYRVIF